MPKPRSDVYNLNNLLEKYLNTGKLGEKSMSQLFELGESKWRDLPRKQKIQIMLKRKANKMDKKGQLPPAERDNCGYMPNVYIEDEEDMIVSDSDTCCPPKKKRKRSPSCAPKKRKKQSCATKKRKPRCPMKKKPRCPKKKKPRSLRKKKMC